jgi:hypothetical protein
MERELHHIGIRVLICCRQHINRGSPLHSPYGAFIIVKNSIPGKSRFIVNFVLYDARLWIRGPLKRNVQGVALRLENAQCDAYGKEL